MVKHSPYNVAYHAGQKLAIDSFLKMAEAAPNTSGNTNTEQLKDRITEIGNNVRGLLSDLYQGAQDIYTGFRMEAPERSSPRAARSTDVSEPVAPAPTIPPASGPSAVISPPVQVGPPNLAQIIRGDTNYNRIAKRLRGTQGLSNLTGRQLAQYLGSRNLRVGDQIDLDSLRSAYGNLGPNGALAGGLVFDRRGQVANRSVLKPRPRPRPSSSAPW